MSFWCFCWRGVWNIVSVWIESEVVVSPPYVFLPTVQASLKSDFQVAAQNCWVKKGGAFTGEVYAVDASDIVAQVTCFSFFYYMMLQIGSHILQSISEENIQFLETEILHSEAAEQLVSTDMTEMLKIAAAHKREEIDIFARELSATQIEAQLEKTLKWLVPVATETTKYVPYKIEAQVEKTLNEVVDYLIDPFVSGVNAGDTERDPKKAT
ncbi:hypothetical protein POM88_022572 [Heracleum sosnowskyi]|uniref:DUF3475 domain-containing protein n=1 Tax=Heracleum sosnowskyi TaxID=360622 RepID=A0AAD8II40_9APIA|nr:hypothetical protein POM88_022572 [Heracleum sosnowskyi]